MFLVHLLAPAAAALILATPTAGQPLSPHSGNDGEQLAIVSQEQLDKGFNPWQPESRAESTFRSGKQAPAPVAQGWAVVKFKTKDRGGKIIPTRAGNSALGWMHFSKKHNITNSNVIKKIISGTSKPDREKGRPHRLVYNGALVTRDGLGFPKKLASIRIVAEYNWQTEDGRYRLPGKSDRIGVITAFCVGTNRCPDKVNSA